MAKKIPYEQRNAELMKRQAIQSKSLAVSNIAEQARLQIRTKLFAEAAKTFEAGRLLALELHELCPPAADEAPKAPDDPTMRAAVEVARAGAQQVADAEPSKRGKA